MSTEANAQPSAPAQGGTAATPPPVAAAPPEPAKAPEATLEPKSKKTGRSRHDEISAKLKAATAAAPPETAKKDGDTPPVAKAPESKKTEEKPDRSPGAVMRLTSEVTRLTKELEAAKSASAAPKGDDSIAALRERVKKDPAVLLDVFGDDLGEDKDKRLERFNDAVLERGTPQHKAASEADERFAKLEKELADEKAKRQGEEATARDVRARAHCEKALTEGLKSEADGSLIVDAAKYPYINHLTKVGEVDAHQGVMLAVRELAKDFRAKQKRDPSNDEVAQMITICADKAEPIFAKRAINYQLPKPATEEQAPTERRAPSTITAGMGSGHGGGVEEKPAKKLTAAEKHAAIRERYRKATAANAAN